MQEMDAGTCRKSKVYGMTDGWPEGWTRKEDDRVARSRERYVRRSITSPPPTGGRGTGTRTTTRTPATSSAARAATTTATPTAIPRRAAAPEAAPAPRRTRVRAVLVVLLLVLVGGYFYLTRG